MYERKEIKEVSYNSLPFFWRLVGPLTAISNPGLRQFTSYVSQFFERILAHLFKVMPEYSDNEIGYIQSGGFPAIKINGTEFPYINLNALTKRSLDRSGLYYKDHWRYKFWHSPVNQFELLRKANSLVEGSLIEPVAIVVNDKSVPTGFIMKKARGKTLAALLGSKELSESDTLNVENGLEYRLAALHANRIGHGDLNDKNIFLDEKLHMDVIDPLESLLPERAMRLDHVWLAHIHSKMARYRRKFARKSYPTKQHDV